MPFGRPDIKSLLHKVPRVGLIMGQTQGKSVERRVVRINQLGKSLVAHRNSEILKGSLFPETSKA
jgi:hypothetical protein